MNTEIVTRRKRFWGGLIYPNYRFQGAIRTVLVILPCLLVIAVAVRNANPTLALTSLASCGMGIFYFVSNFWRLWVRRYTVDSNALTAKACEPGLVSAGRFVRSLGFLELIRQQTSIPWDEVLHWEKWPLRGKGNFEYRLLASEGRRIVWSAHMVPAAADMAREVAKYIGEPKQCAGDHRSGPNTDDPAWLRPWEWSA